MTSIISQAYLDNGDDLPAIPLSPSILLSESFCLEKLTSYEEYIILPGPDDVKIGGIGRGRSSRNRWENVHITQKLSSQDEIIETIRKLDTSRSIASKLANLYSNQRKHIENIVYGKSTKERRICFTWVLAQLHCNDVRNLEARTKETASINVYIKRAPLSGMDVIRLYRERQEQAASKQRRQQTVTGQDTDQRKHNLVDIYKINPRMNSMNDVVPRGYYNNQERVGSMPPASAVYNSNQQDQLNTGMSSNWSVPERVNFPQSDLKQVPSSEMPPTATHYAEHMQRTESTDSNVSSSPTSRSRQQLQRQYQHTSNRKLAAKGGSDDVESQAVSALLRTKSKDGQEDRFVAPISKTPYQRPRHERLFCDLCDDREGFHGAHELGRHKDRQHPGKVKKWVCIEPLDGVKDEFRPVNPLTKCKACKGNKEYGAYYNAAAHLRRAHFLPKPRGRSKSGKADDKSEKRGGRAGGDWPPMKELKRWMEDIYVSADAAQQDSDEEWSENNLLANLGGWTNMAPGPSNPTPFDHDPLDRSPFYPANKSTNMTGGPSNTMSFSSSYAGPPPHSTPPLDRPHLDRTPLYPADYPSNPMSFDHSVVSRADDSLFSYFSMNHFLKSADYPRRLPYLLHPNSDLRPPGLEEPELKHHVQNWNKLGKSSLGELSTGSRSLKEQKPEHVLRESKLKGHGKLTKEHITVKDEVDVGGPFTDSGYASILKTNIYRNDQPSPDKRQCPVDDKSSVQMGDEDTEDAKTIYSAATSIDLPHSQQYIAELCSDIFSKLENHFDSTNWSTLEKALPSLIKAFAIKIGHDSSDQVNQDIMYFIHKKHNVIISHLKTMFCCKDDGQPTSGQRGPKGMSLLDKMSMWDSKASEIDTAAKNDELFEGVGDDDDEITNEVGLSKYHGVILKSPSYEWLLSSLRKEFSLQWDSRQPRIMVENIRQRILDKLPTGTISKRRPLNACEVTFNLQLDDTTDRGNQMFEKLVDLEISLSELVAVTGCQKESQALTVEQYMCQTWATFGLQLLNLLHRVIIDSRHCSVDLPDNTQLKAGIKCSRFIITAIGPAQFIAECAEQLAWLQAAFFSNSQIQAGYCVPSIGYYRIHTAPSRTGKLKYKGLCDVDVGLTPLANPTDAITPKPSWQQNLVGKSTVIQGFPISRRPEAYPGLELSFELLLSSVQTEQAIIDDGLVLLRGPISTLQLLKDTNDVFLWQPFHPRNGICSCGEHHMEIRLNIPYSSFDLRRLKTGRHILGACKDILATMAEGSEGMCERSSLSEAKCVQDHTSRDIRPSGNPQNVDYNPNANNPNEVLSAPPETQHDEKDSGSSTSNKVDNSVPNEGLPLCTESLDGPLLSDDQTPLAADSPSNSTMPSQDESLDSDMLSISDASEQLELPENNAALNAFIDDVVNNLLSGFRSTTQCQFSQAASGNGGQSASTIRPAETGSSTTSGNSGRSGKKRRAADDDDDNADQDDHPKPPRKKICHNPDKGPQISLACPYLKMDPVTHGKCCARQLTRIRDVKQHLMRRHTPARYCQRCMDTNFCDEKTLKRHVDLGTCQSKDSTTLEGISIAQRTQLQEKSNHKISEEKQWFAIWDILFLGCARPRSAYMDTELSMELRLFREYCDTHGQSVVDEQYESSLVWPGSESTTEERQVFLQMAIARGMNRAFDDFRLSTRSLESLRSREQSDESIQPAQSEAAPSSFADSGIAEDSQSSPREVSSRRHVPSQSPAVFGNGEPSASIPDDENSRSQIPSRAPPIFDNRAPGAWTEQDGISGMQQGLENGPLELFDFDRFCSSEPDFDYSNPP